MHVACVYHPRQQNGGKFHYIADAFRRIGCEVAHVQTVEELREADKSCDLVLFEQRVAGTVDPLEVPIIARQKSAVWMQWYFDLCCFDDNKSLTEQAEYDWSTFGPMLQAMDMVFVKERSRLLEYHQNDVKAIWFDQACPSTMPACAYLPDPQFDVVLWGQSGSLWKQRVADVETLVSAGFRVGWAGTPHVPKGVTALPWCHPDELPGLISRGKISLQVDAVQHVNGFYSDRIWLACGAGACSLRRISIGQSCLPCMGYASAETLVSETRRLCQSLDLRQEIGERARRITMAHNTYEHRCREILKYAEYIKNQRSEESNLSPLQGHRGNCSEDQRCQESASLSSLH